LLWEVVTEQYKEQSMDYLVLSSAV